MALHGRNGTVKVGGTAVGAVYSWSYDATADQVDVTSMDDTAKQYLTGLADGSGTIECRLDTGEWASGDGQENVYASFSAGTQVSLDLISTTDSGEYGGLSGTTAVITSFAISQSFDDAVNLTFGFQGTLAPYAVA